MSESEYDKVERQIYNIIIQSGLTWFRINTLLENVKGKLEICGSVTGKALEEPKESGQ